METAIPVGQGERGIRVETLCREVGEIPSTPVSAPGQGRCSFMQATTRGLHDLKGGLWGTVHCAPR